MGCWITELYVKEMSKQLKIELMGAKEYQDIINQTAIFPREIGLAYCAMGISDEAGEVSGKIKKLYRDKDYFNTKFISETDKRDIAKELGDVLWYMTATADLIGYTLQEIMEMNYRKLMLRRATNTLHGDGDNREEL